MTTPERRAEQIASILLATVKDDDDWLMLSILGNKLTHAAWGHQVRGMLKPRGEQVRRPHYKQRLADVFVAGLKAELPETD